MNSSSQTDCYKKLVYLIEINQVELEKIVVKNNSAKFIDKKLLNHARKNFKLRLIAWTVKYLNFYFHNLNNQSKI